MKNGKEKKETEILINESSKNYSSAAYPHFSERGYIDVYVV
jgi:hypothetical protein